MIPKKTKLGCNGMMERIYMKRFEPIMKRFFNMKKFHRIMEQFILERKKRWKKGSLHFRGFPLKNFQIKNFRWKDFKWNNLKWIVIKLKRISLPRTDWKFGDKLKIRHKLHLVSGIAIGMNVLLIIIVFNTLQTAEHKMQSFYDTEYKNSILQMQIRNDVAMLDHEILAAVFSDDYQKSSQTVDIALQKTVADVNVLKKSFFEEQLMKELNTALNAFITEEMKVMSFAFAGHTEGAMKAINGDYAQSVDTLYKILDTVSVKADEAAETALLETVRQRKSMTLLLICSMAVSGVILLAAAGMLEKTIKQATNKILEITQRIKKGELAASGEKHTPGDELDEVICACEQMSGELHTLIFDIGHMLEEASKGNMVYQTQNRQSYVGEYKQLLLAAETMQQYINIALNNVNTATLKVEEQVMSVYNGAQQLSADAVKQNDSISQLSATLTFISERAGQNAEQIQKMSKASAEMNTQVDITNQYMVETTTAIQDVLGHTAQIKRILRTIDEIAFQTDLLALNASIEAARAGVAGRGFAVVAGEVRALAKRVTEASKETAELLDNAMKLTNHCANTVSSTAESLEVAVERTTDITNMITLVSDAIQKEQEDIGNIAEESETIRNIVCMNAETAKQFAKGGEEGYRQVNILKEEMQQFIWQEVNTGDTEKIS